MTALHPVTREIRTCPAAVGPPTQQSTAITDAELRAAFDEANRIWRQARIRFELENANIVRETYAFRTDCEVDESEFTILLERCAYPDAVNVFFFGDLAGLGEAGFGVSPEGGAALGVAGCAVGDRFQTTILGPPLSLTLDAQQRAQVLAHELGHFLNLDHAEDTPANADRLMLPGTFSATNTILTKDEVNRARTSRGATDDCVPLKLRVSGATQIGGSLSHEFIVIQSPVGVVTVDAEIPDRLLAPERGTLTMTGGNPGANDRQRTVSAATTGVTEVVGTYTPTSGSPVVTRRVVIHVATFTLDVDGATPTAPGGATFAARREPGRVVTILVNLSPAPFCVPTTLVVWTGGDAQPDPLRRRVPKDTIRQATVRATLASVTRSVTITIFEVAVTNNVPPFGTAVAQAQIEGVLNKDLRNIDLADLFDTQPNSLFRIRADIPGLAVNVGQFFATLTSNPPAGATIETIAVTLQRTTPSGDTFLSAPILAIPAAFQQSEVGLKSPPNMNVVRARAGGRIRVEVNPPLPLGNLGRVEIRVRGRVLYLFAQALANSALGISSGISLADLQRKITRASRIWAQAGIEIKTRRVAAPVESPAELLDVEHTDNTGVLLTEEEKRLVGRIVRAGDPTRSNVATDLNVFYVRSLDRPPPPAADPSGIAYPNDPVIVVEGRTTKDEALAHEIGHQIIDWGGQDEHKDLTGAGWPSTNVLHQFDTGGGEVDRSQVLDVLNSMSAGTNKFVIFEA